MSKITQCLQPCIFLFILTTTIQDSSGCDSINGSHSYRVVTKNTENGTVPVGWMNTLMDAAQSGSIDATVSRYE